MKAVWFVVGVLGAVYGLFGVAQLLGIFKESDPTTAGGGSMIAAGVLPVLVGLIVCLVGFQKAFKKPTP